jgi:hypothetical protein
MGFDPDHNYYQNNVPTSPGPYTPRQISNAPDKRIDIMYKDADGMSNGELNAKVVWADDVAIYLERGAEDDFLVPWRDIIFIKIQGLN